MTLSDATLIRSPEDIASIFLGDYNVAQFEAAAATIGKRALLQEHEPYMDLAEQLAVTRAGSLVAHISKTILQPSESLGVTCGTRVSLGVMERPGLYYQPGQGFVLPTTHYATIGISHQNAGDDALKGMPFGWMTSGRDRSDFYRSNESASWGSRPERRMGPMAIGRWNPEHSDSRNKAAWNTGSTQVLLGRRMIKRWLKDDFQPKKRVRTQVVDSLLECI